MLIAVSLDVESEVINVRRGLKLWNCEKMPPVFNCFKTLTGQINIFVIIVKEMVKYEWTNVHFSEVTCGCSAKFRELIFRSRTYELSICSANALPAPSNTEETLGS